MSPWSVSYTHLDVYKRQIPDANTHVIIPAGTPNPCLVSLQDAAAASIQVKTGGLFNIQNNRKLNIAGKCATLPN